MSLIMFVHYGAIHKLQQVGFVVPSAQQHLPGATKDLGDFSLEDADPGVCWTSLNKKVSRNCPEIPVENSTVYISSYLDTSRYLCGHITVQTFMGSDQYRVFDKRNGDVASPFQLSHEWMTPSAATRKEILFGDGHGVFAPQGTMGPFPLISNWGLRSIIIHKI